MGVPKFFRYTSERYPCLNELVKQYQIPEFDNMYLDMNGIIHTCSHPDDSNTHFRITEEKIFKDIFHYLTVLFQIIKPKKLFFMAIDGVAPRAKMNQQRGRRFRSAREAETLEKQAKEKGETLPSEKRFDSNCITPGTVFMTRLHEQLRYFVKSKVSTDPMWSKCRIVLSGHETPGEGEHKIMDYIRWARSQPDYDPDTRHCLYGLDADLIMLGMCTHEPHFALLREEVKFSKSTHRSTSPEETNFYLLHLSLMRDYLEQEFLPIKDALPFQWDMEKIIDDWVLMGFLVGNDFIPNLPNMHISNDALPLLYKTYMDVLPTLDGYINEMGILNLGRFEIFMQELSKIDREAFQETMVDLKYFQEKTGRRPNANERKQYKPNDDETFNVNVDDIKSGSDDLQALINATDDLFKDVEGDETDDWEDISDEEANFNVEFASHKKDYYMNKLDYKNVTPEVLASQAEGYVRAIQWNLHYYYRGCASWCWYYPHHYAPYISDIKGFKDLKINFELGKPFNPFEQLLAVLPAASKELLPEPFHPLMTDEVSPIFDYYPVNFDTDLNGKKNDWEAVVLIPFIDEKRLLSAMEPIYEHLTQEERKRNSHGPMRVYNYSQTSQGTVHAPDYFPAIPECHCSESSIWRNELDVPPDQLREGVLPGAHTQFYFPGFPTLKHMQYKTYLKANKCRVFDQPSRNVNMIVELVRNEPEPHIEEVVRQLLGKVVWVGWPHLTQAKVISISNEEQRYNVPTSMHSLNGNVSYEVEQNVGNNLKKWIAQRSIIIDHNNSRMGIELGDVNIIVHAVNLKGHKYVVQDNTTLAVEQVWCEIPCGYAYQAVLKEVRHKSTAIRRNASPEEVFPPGAGVFLMTGPYYGCLAQVTSLEDVERSGRIKVHVTTTTEPKTSLPVNTALQYKPAHHIAAATGISPRLLSRITGCVFVIAGKRNNLPNEQQSKYSIGLNLKFNKKNQEVSGYTRRCPTTGAWLYSAQCQEAVEAYSRKFPHVIDGLTRFLELDVFEGDLWPANVGEGKPQELERWLKQQPHASATRRDCGAVSLEPHELVRLTQHVDKQLQALRQLERRVTLQIKIKLVYVPSLHEGNIPPDPAADYQLYDRVVCVANKLTVPMGAKGTITAVYHPGVTNTVRLSDKMNTEPTYQILFDETFPGAMSEDNYCEPRFYRLSGCHLLNISYGRKLREKNDPASDYQPQILTNNRPTQLRTDDGHHSAFASYSPTRDRQTDLKTDTASPVTSAKSAPPLDPQEQSTELLKSLLKISQPSSTPDQQSKSSDNWRAKLNYQQSPSQPAIQQQQQQQQQQPQQQHNTRSKQPTQNWRGECGAQPPALPPPLLPLPPRPQAGWNPTLLHNNGALFNKANGGRVHGRFPPPPAGLPFPPPPRAAPHPFPYPPPALPASIAPSFMYGNEQMEQRESKQRPPQSVPWSPPTQEQQPLHNPFVPLQVVAKQRRAQNPSAPVAKPTACATRPVDARPAPPESRPIVQASPKKIDAPKPERQKRSRIAANFSMS